MTTAAEIKFELEKVLIAQGRTIVGLHSVHVADGAVFAGYDVAPGDDVLFYEFVMTPMPVSREEVVQFALWLADRSSHGTLH